MRPARCNYCGQWEPILEHFVRAEPDMRYHCKLKIEAQRQASEAAVIAEEQTGEPIAA
jgi:hypothetical protein